MESLRKDFQRDVVRKVMFSTHIFMSVQWNFNPEKKFHLPLVKTSKKIKIVNVLANLVSWNQNNLNVFRQNYSGSKTIKVMYHTVPLIF